MTGTSMDALDAALVQIDGRGLDLTATLLRTHSEPLDKLARLLRPLAHQKRFPADKFRRCAFMLGMTHLVALRKLLGDEADTLDLIAVHGQTIYHEPRMSWQLMDPWPLASEFRRPVVFDLRGADCATGGVGAPITPIVDHLLFRHARETRAVVNLGGFVNFTWLPPTRRARGDAAALRSIRAGDVCVCNQLLDAIARRSLRKSFDADGAAALSGTVDAEALTMLAMMLDGQADKGGRSLGTGDEATQWVGMFAGDVPGPDLARTACAAVAQTVAGHIGEADRVLVAGGGVHNQALLAELRTRLAKVETTDAHGVPTQVRESMAIAILGALCQDRVPITLPQVTGVMEPIVSGAWALP